MKPPVLTFLAALGAVLLLGAPQPLAADPAKVIVFAAASLREAFEAAQPAFARQTGMAVTFNFGGSDALEQQLVQGASADVFASANQTQMKRAADGGLLDSPATIFAHNRLVAIVAKARAADLHGLADLAKPGVKVVLADATVPVGAYARTALHALDGRKGFDPAFDTLVEKNVVSEELDVKAVATKVSLGEADAGIVYATDVAPIASSVQSYPFPSEVAPDISYPIATLKAAPNAAGAKAFVDFITHEGQTYLRARGFLPP